MAPSRISNGDSDASSNGDIVMNDVSGPIARVKRDNGDFLMRVSSLPGKDLACSIQMFIHKILWTRE
jgi:hypothetical protein